MSFASVGKILFAIEALDYTKQVFKGVSDSIMGLQNLLEGVMSAAIQWSRKLMGIFKQVVTAVWGVIESIVNAISSIAGNFGGGIIGGIMSIISAMIQLELTVKQVSLEILGMLGDTVLAAIEAVTDAVMAQINAFVKLGGEAWQALGMVALGVYALGQDLYELTADFEHQFGEVEALVKGFGRIFQTDMSEATDRIRETIFKMGQETFFTVQEISDAMSMFIKVGIEPVEEGFDKAVESIMKMAALEDMNLDKAISVISTAMYGFGLSVKDVPRIVDTLTGAAVISVAEIKDLATALSYAASTSNMLGFSLEDTVTYLGAMTDVFTGMRKGLPGRYWRSMLKDLADPNVNKVLEAQSNSLGEFVDMTLWTEAGTMKPFGDWLQTIKSVVGDLPEEEFMKWAKSIGFTQQSSDAFFVLLNTEIERFEEFGMAIDQAGITLELFQDRTENIADQFTIMKNAIETLWVVFTSRFTQPIADFLAWFREDLMIEGGGLKSWIEDLGDAFGGFMGQISKEGQEGTGVLGALQALFSDASFQQLGQTLIKVFSQLADTGLTAGVEAIKGLVKALNSEGFSNFIEMFSNFITAMIPAFGKGFMGGLQLIGEVFEQLMEREDFVTSVGACAGNVLGFAMSFSILAALGARFIDIVMSPLLMITGVLLDNMDRITEVFGGVVGSIMDFVDRIFLSKGAMESWGATLNNIITNIIQPALEAGKEFIDTMMEGDRLSDFIDAVIIFAGAFTTGFITAITELATTFTDFVNSLNDMNSETGEMKSGIEVLASFFVNILPKLLAISIQLLDSLLQGCVGKGIREMFGAGGVGPKISGDFGAYHPGWLSPQQRARAMGEDGWVEGDEAHIGGGKWSAHQISEDEKNAWKKWEDAGNEIDVFMDAVNQLSGGIQMSFPTGDIAGGCLGEFLGMQHGGIVTGPTPALIGEHGPEAVIPLNKMPELFSMANNINIYTGPIMSDVDLANAVRQGLLQASDEVRLKSRMYYA